MTPFKKPTPPPTGENLALKTYLAALISVALTGCGSSPTGATGWPVTNTFSPNATTISTSEGAPYADCDFWIRGPNECANQSNFGYGPTRVLRLYVCLSGEVSTSSCSQQPAVTGPLSQAMLDDIDARLSAFAGTGVRLVVRFTYNFGPIGSGAMDAPIDVISGHVDQLAPLLLKNQDLMFALEAGFIGTWGEWHDSTNGNDTAAAQETLLDKELSYFGGVFPILVRYPGDLIQYTGSVTPPTGLGLHDDYYASNASDGATWNACDTGAGYCLPNYTSSQLQAYAAAVSATSMFAGEFGALAPSLQSCNALMGYSYTYHLQSLSLFTYPSTIGEELESEGCALSFYSRVGTRIELKEAFLEGQPTPGGELAAAITLVNTGFGRVVRPRPVSLVFVSSGVRVAEVPVPLSDMDLRELVPSPSPVAQTFRFKISLPPTFPSSGSVEAALLIADPAPSLSTQPAYALPLNSLDQKGVPVFDPATGYNTIATFEAE